MGSLTLSGNAASRRTRTLLPGLVLCMLLAGITTPARASVPNEVDPELRQLLMQAVAESDSFPDRFEAEVWLTDMSTRLSKKIPEPQTRLNLLRQIHFEATRAGLTPEVVLSVINVESNFNRYAISRAGAMGLMQVMPFWLKEIGRPGDNLFNPRTNLRLGCTILKYYLDKEKGNLTEALARYNGSRGSFKYVRKIYQALDKQWGHY